MASYIQNVLFRFSLALFAAQVLFSTVQANAQAIETKAKQAILLDAGSGAILFQKSADESVPPASLAKLMTLEVVFNGLKTGTWTASSLYPVSEDAWRRGGAPSGTATMFAALKSRIPLADLVRGAAIPIANDASLVIAEGLAGSEAAFVEQMNMRAKAIGLKSSSFVNSTGLPQDGQFVTMRDMASLARHLLLNYPEQAKVFSETEFTWNKITQRNRNPLIGSFEGADGLGLGFTKDVGFSIVASARRNNLHIIMALGGLQSEKERNEEARRLLQYAFSSLEQVSVYLKGDILGEASVFGGEKLSVPVAPLKDVSVLVEAGSELQLKASISYSGPLVAPIVKDQPVGKLQVSLKDTVILEAPVHAAEDVGRGTLAKRALSAAKELATGWIRNF